MPRLTGNNSHDDETSWPHAAIVITLILATVAVLYILARFGSW